MDVYVELMYLLVYIKYMREYYDSDIVLDKNAYLKHK